MQPEDLPVTSWLDDRVQHLDPSAWRLATGKGELSLRDITGMPQVSFSATLDCTGGWYSNQIWTGVRLDGLVDAGESRSFEVRSATGYTRRFPVRDLSHVWLVTALDGRPLAAGHGFPARLVAPHRRGYWWVKWVVSIRPSSIPWWVQSPFPLT
jgi:DMSO/TMAO reductase YedYZ molybdopterin-dependent catalytic subunit